MKWEKVVTFNLAVDPIGRIVVNEAQTKFGLYVERGQEWLPQAANKSGPNVTFTSNCPDPLNNMGSNIGGPCGGRGEGWRRQNGPDTQFLTTSQAFC